MANSSGVGHRVLRRGGLLVAGIALPLGSLLAYPVAAAEPSDGSATQTVTVADSAEAWYAAAPVDICTTPLGCPPSAAPTSPYPADTLHVGLASGQETARTYLVPDLLSLPYGATPISGTMTLPVATATGDGTLSPNTAKIKACLVTKSVPDGTQGSTSAPPSVDCATSATASYDAAKSVFTIDLLPFLQVWLTNPPANGIALIPDTSSAQPTDAWHVTFNGRKRASTPHISSTITVTAAPDTSTSGGVTSPSTGVVPPAAPAVPLPVSAAAPPVAAPPVVAGAPPAQAPVVQAQPVAFVRPFQYPLAFLLPLVLLGGAVFLARLFTRDATPRYLNP